MKHLLIDTDVVLDVLLGRAPHDDLPSALWAAGELGRCRLSISAHAVTTIFYLASRHRDPATARRLVGDLLSVFGIATVDGVVLKRAAALEMKDFEDAVACAAAEAMGCDAVVTRNLVDFDAALVPAVDPATALAWIDETG